MKYIREFSEVSDPKFTPDEIMNIKDVYNDIVDDLDLYDNKHALKKI